MARFLLSQAFIIYFLNYLYDSKFSSLPWGFQTHARDKILHLFSLFVHELLMSLRRME